MVSGAGCKQKGARYENEVARYLSEKTEQTIRRKYACHDGQWNGEEDLDAPLLSPECKRVEALRLTESMEQAEKNARPGKIPLVITRKNKQPLEESYVVLRLKHFVPFYVALLKERGK